jgi:hypothetical protein
MSGSVKKHADVNFSLSNISYDLNNMVTLLRLKKKSFANKIPL